MSQTQQISKYSLTFFSSVIFLASTLAQTNKNAPDPSKFIKAEELKVHLEVLASDAYEGRETGQKGQKMAAEYIKKHFENIGIPPLQNLKQGYFQEFALDVYMPQELSISINGKKFEAKKDFFSYSSILSDTTLILEGLQFSGYGINADNYSDFNFEFYSEKNLEKRNVVVFSKEPLDKNGNSLLTGDKNLSDWSTNPRRKSLEAQKQKINIQFIVEENLMDAYKRSEHKITSSKMKITDNKSNNLFSTPFTIYISKEMASYLFGDEKKMSALKEKILKEKKSINEKVKTNIQLSIKQESNSLLAENVLGYIEGGDLKDELIVVTAHYDHLGIHDGIVFNGADDDGSGTVAVMQIAKAFAEAKKAGIGPRRSLLFMTVSGEEKGLLGSEYYTNKPVFPLNKTVANLNIDMIGRIDDAHKGNADYIYLIGSDKLSDDLHRISEECNNKYSRLKLDYTYNSDSDPNRFYYRSDHYNFAKNNIPVIFYFNGVHEDYHRETDDVNKIDFNKIEKISKLIFHTAWELANQSERIKLKKQ